MKALVAIKRVIDYNVKVKIKSDESDVDLSNTKMSINPFCEIAVEEAVRLKEKGVITEVVVVSIGTQKTEEQIRAAMALGADRGYLVESNNQCSSLVVAKILKALVEREQPDLVILGKQSIDTDNNQTGQMLAALWDRPQGTFVSGLTLESGKAIITREIDGGLETLALKLPAVITTDLRLNEPRYAKLPDIMKAKKKPLEKIKIEDLSINSESKNVVTKVETPPVRKGGIKVSSLDELIDKLKNEAKVLP